MLGPFCVWLECVRREIANYGKDCCNGERGVDNGRPRLRQVKGFAPQQTRVAEDAVGCGEGKKQRDEGVEVHCFGDVSVK